MPKTPLKSARRRASWTAWTSLRLAHPAHEAEQNQKKRTSDVLPKPDNLIRYRQENPIPRMGDRIFAKLGRGPGAIYNQVPHKMTQPESSITTPVTSTNVAMNGAERTELRPMPREALAAPSGTFAPAR